MIFKSYAQNFEDVMLWRALKQIPNGTYVDVGAYHPLNDSVSKGFYEQGWRGIHIEPLPEYAELLRQDRPDEIVLEIALGDVEGKLDFNVMGGLSTAVTHYAEQHQKENGVQYNIINVPVLTLQSALISLIGKEVHWLKIDVEGFEEKVLRGWNSQILRPWIMVLEATIPNSPQVNYEGWEPILIAANYQFVYFDGLNRFYIAQEHPELRASFSCPPNVFDRVDFISGSQLYRQKLTEFDQLKQQLNKMYKSRSWRITAPLRKMMERSSIIRKLLSGVFRKNRQLLGLTRDKASFLQLNNIQSRFEYIFNHNHWGSPESRSGDGSTLASTQLLRSQLEVLLKELDVKIFFDAPCGDWNWMQKVRFPVNMQYIGGDIVPSLICLLNKKYRTKNINFIHMNIIEDILPVADLWLCRDTLFHFSYEDIFKLFNNFMASKIPYILMTTMPNVVCNEDIKTGDYRSLNLQIAPFNFPTPQKILHDKPRCEELHHVALWHRDDLISFFAEDKICEKSFN